MDKSSQKVAEKPAGDNIALTKAGLEYAKENNIDVIDKSNSVDDITKSFNARLSVASGKGDFKAVERIREYLFTTVKKLGKVS